MDIELQAIKSHGDYDKEYVTLKVLSDCDSGGFLLADTTYNDDDTVSARLRHLFWLPSKEVSEGDFIRVFTRAGDDREYGNDKGTTTHVFYWGLRAAVWNDNGDCAVLFQATEWEFRRVK